MVPAAHASFSAAEALARDAADDDIEECDDAVDDGLENRRDGVHDGHNAVADGAEDRLELRGLLVVRK